MKKTAFEKNDQFLTGTSEHRGSVDASNSAVLGSNLGDLKKYLEVNFNLSVSEVFISKSIGASYPGPDPKKKFSATPEFDYSTEI